MANIFTVDLGDVFATSSEEILSLIGTAAQKNAATIIDTNSNDDTVPTSKAVSDYVSNSLDSFGVNELGSASTKEAADSFSDTDIVNASFVNGYYNLKSNTTPSKVNSALENNVVIHKCAKLTCTKFDKLFLHIYTHTQYGAYRFYDAEGNGIGSPFMMNEGDDPIDGYVDVPENAVTVYINHRNALYPTGYSARVEQGANAVPTVYAVNTNMNTKLYAYATKSYVDGKDSASLSQINANTSAISALSQAVDGLGEASTHDVAAAVSANNSDLATSAIVYDAINSAKAEANLNAETLVNTLETGKVATLETASADYASRIAATEDDIDELDRDLHLTLRHMNDPFSNMFNSGFIGVESTPQGNTIKFIGTNLDRFTHICFPVPGGQTNTLSIIVNNVYPHAEYAFLTEYGKSDEVSFALDPIHGQGLRYIAPPLTSDTVAIPSGTRYVYVACNVPDGDMTPKSVKINDVEMMYGIRERMDVMSKQNVWCGSAPGSLGENDWSHEIEGLTISREGNRIKVSGKHTGSYNLCVKVTGSFCYGTTVNSSFNDETDTWADTIPEPVYGSKLQLQTYCFYKEWDSDTQGIEPMFRCYSYSNPASNPTSIGGRYAINTSLGYSSYYCLSEGTTPKFITMNINSGSDFETGYEFSVWLEEMKYVADVQSMSSLVASLQSNVLALMNTDATIYHRGMMTAEDKLKLDNFLDASMYVTKDDAAVVYTYRGSVANIASLPVTESTNSVYYVISDGHSYVYNGSTWDDLGTGATVASVSTAEIDDLF